MNDESFFPEEYSVSVILPPFHRSLLPKLTPWSHIIYLVLLQLKKIKHYFSEKVHSPSVWVLSPHGTNWLKEVKIGSIYLLLQKSRVVVLMLYFHVCFIFFPLRRQTSKWKLTQTMRKTPVADSSPVFQRIGYYARPKRTQVGFTTSIPWPGRAAGNIPWYLTWIPRWEFVIIQQSI